MNRILILDRDLGHAEALMASLRRADRYVEMCADERTALANSIAKKTDVLIVVPFARSLWKEQVCRIRTILSTQLNRPTVMCILRWAPQGPADRLFGDSLEVEVLHEY